MYESLTLAVNALFLMLAIGYIAYLSSSTKRSSSNLITLSIVLVVGLAMTLLNEFLKDISNKDLLRFLWFNSFALCNMLIVWSILKLHELHKLKYSLMAKYSTYSYTTMATLQIVTYWDHAFFGSGTMVPIYHYAIPAIELSVRVSLIFFLLKDSLNFKITIAKA